MNKRKSMHYPIKGIAMVASIIIAGHLAAMALNGEPLIVSWVENHSIFKIMSAILLLALFIILMFTFYSKLQNYFGIKSLSPYTTVGNKVLLIPMSPPSKNIKPKNGGYAFPLTLVDSKGRGVTLCGDDLLADIDTLNNIENWNWQQFMRSLKPHKLPHGDILERVYLFGSKTIDPIPGSFAFLDDAEGIILKYFPGVKVVKYRNEIDFRDFSALHKCMNETVDEALRKGYRENEISIDTTGGIKTASIVGATITFNRKISFQYVDTNPPYECYTYDVVHHHELPLV